MFAKQIIQSMNSALRTLLVTSLIAGVALAVLTTPTVLARTSDGTLEVDSTFDPDPNYFVMALALQPDGKILVGGYFTDLKGVGRNYIASAEPRRHARHHLHQPRCG